MGRKLMERQRERGYACLFVLFDLIKPTLIECYLVIFLKVKIGCYFET